MKHKKYILITLITLFAAGSTLGISCHVQAAEEAYTVSGNTITVDVQENTDIADTLNSALKEAHALDEADGVNDTVYTVKVPAGTYKIGAILHIYSNTTLDVTGTTLNWSGTESHNMLVAGDPTYNVSSACSGYDGFQNITITGGTWHSDEENTSCFIRLFHATNVRLEHMVIDGGSCEHQVEVAAINGFYVYDVTFQNRYNPSTDENQEALQLDIPCSSDVYKNIVEDGTTMQNVEITYCTFNNVPRGVGTHTMLVGAYFDNIVISNNTFKNIATEAIVAVNYKNCTIENNTITNCGSGVLFQYCKDEDDSIYTTIYDGEQAYNGQVIHNAGTVIKNNNITITAQDSAETVGIKIRSYEKTGKTKGADGKTIPKQNFYVTGITIENNTITTAGHGIILAYARDINVIENTITGTASGESDGIFLSEKATNAVITNNTIKNMPRNGIFLMKNSSVGNISYNTITNCKNYGIGLYSKCQSDGSISNNTIQGSGSYGISLSTSSNVKNISDNVIKNPKSRGISVWKKCSVTGDISGNEIVNAKQEGIMISTNSTVKNIKNNKVTSPKTYGINVYKSSTVKGSISGNTITGSGLYSISLSTSSKVKTISTNTIKNSKSRGISVWKKCSVTGDITGNKITNAKKDGILISTNSTVKNITKNTITNAKEYGINVYKSSKVKGNISGNTIKKAGKSGISLNEKSVVNGNIVKNKIASPGVYGICVYNNAKVNGKVNNNKITGTNKKTNVK